MTSREQLAYNATVGEIRRIHDELMVLRVIPDKVLPEFQPGQYTTLGLKISEPRIDGTAVEFGDSSRMIRRAYSISHPLPDDSATLFRPSAQNFLEFYIALVKRGSDEPPSLTPRIFALSVGDRLFMGPRPKGSYTLESVTPKDDVIFVATGTGEAPHNTMIAELCSRKHEGRLASFVCVRHWRDLAYLHQHRTLERLNSHYRYVPLTTREPENVDPSRAGFIGRKYVQKIFAAAELEAVLGWIPNPATSHVFLCGNPAMIGVPKRTDDGGLEFPSPPGMIETLLERGFRDANPHMPGCIHFEQYW